ncbi:histone-lysine N-methyltransferase SETMAR [Plakobranchus ocellatus]|uniref:Histone-lysine N-methyltransferase SETMAR n=1 Tax=Plakobranchus ocellatus TaxID=259542 RepID=A0AAV4C2U1_9GAST|nr:histone-lysine N-methyltransferase SETMAR [Plakobranchus ocellatus]
MEYRHTTSPSPRKFKVVASARKVMFTVFWDMEGVVHMEFLEQGQTVNSEHAHQSPNSGRLKAAGTYDPTAPCIQPRSCPL